MHPRDDRLKVAAVGVSAADRVMLKALVNLTVAAGRRRWQFVDGPPASVVVVDPESTEGRAYLRQPSGGMLVTIGAEGRRPTVHPHLTRPIRNQDLRDILAQVDGLWKIDADSQALSESVDLGDSSLFGPDSGPYSGPYSGATPAGLRAPPHPTAPPPPAAPRLATPAATPAAAQPRREPEPARSPAAAPRSPGGQPAPNAPFSAADRLERLRGVLLRRDPPGTAQGPMAGAQPPAPSPGLGPTQAPPPALAAVGAAWHPILLQLRRGASRHRLLFCPPEGPTFAAAMDTERAYVDGTMEDLLALGATPAERIAALRVPERRLDTLALTAKQYPLDNLRWFLGLHFSGGRLLPDPARWGRYRLVRWPDFGQLPYRRYAARLSRMLLSRAASLEDLVRHAQTPEPEVIGYLNAVYLSGWLVAATALAAPPTLQAAKAPERQGLLARLRRSLGL